MLIADTEWITNDRKSVLQFLDLVTNPLQVPRFGDPTSDQLLFGHAVDLVPTVEAAVQERSLAFG
jgi:hypothetical protein